MSASYALGAVQHSTSIWMQALRLPLTPSVRDNFFKLETSDDHLVRGNLAYDTDPTWIIIAIRATLIWDFQRGSLAFID